MKKKMKMMIQKEKQRKGRGKRSQLIDNEPKKIRQEQVQRNEATYKNKIHVEYIPC